MSQKMIRDSLENWKRKMLWKDDQRGNVYERQRSVGAGKSLGRMDLIDETTGVTDARMDGLFTLGRLEGNRIRPRFWVFLLKCPKIGPNSR
jgi:hypothetical protein